MIRLRTALIVSAALALAAGAVPASAAESDSAFVQKAVAGDSSEIMLGKLAEVRGGTPGVRSFGAMLVTDHTEGRKEALHTAAAIGLTPAMGPTGEARAERAKLMGLSGPAFDAEFSRYMVSDHEEDIADFQKEARDGHGPAAEFARKTLPTLEKHLATARDLSNQSG